MKFSRTEKPADFSFMHYKQLDETTPDKVSSSRLGRPPPLGPNNKLETRCIWLNHNGLTSMVNLDKFLESVIENHRNLVWLDLSYNKLTDIDQGILLFENLQIIYLHGNMINDVKEVLKIKPLKKLKTLTSHGNPVYSKDNYRAFVISNLTQLESLDFTRITPNERISASSLDRKVT